MRDVEFVFFDTGRALNTTRGPGPCQHGCAQAAGLKFHMRQLSGVWRGERDELELGSGDTADSAAGQGVRVVVLPHTNRGPGAARIMAEYLRGGVEAVRAAAPDSALMLHDAKSHALLLLRDALGTTPLYYGTSLQDFAFGTRVADVARVLSIRLTPNRASLAALLVDHSAASPGQTYFAQISAVPPGCGLLRRSRETTLLPPVAHVKPTPPTTFDEAAVMFAEQFRASVSARVDAQRPTAVLVSGGLDSGAIMCVAREFGEVTGVNYAPKEYPEADETRYIELLRANGMRIESVPFYPTMDIAALERSVLAGETPSFDLVPLTLERAAATARALGARTLLSGTWGDQVLSPFPPVHLASVSPWHVRRLRALAQSYHAYMTDVPMRDIERALYRQSLSRRLPSRVRAWRQKRQSRNSRFDVLAAEFAQSPRARSPRSYADALYDGVYAPQQAEAIEGTTKWGHATGLDARLPFLDFPLIQFMGTLPPEFVYHEQSLKPLLRAGMRGKVPGALLGRRDKGDYTAAITRGALPVRAVLETLDSLRRPVENGLMSRAAAAKTLAELRAASDISLATSNLATVLLALDMWLRLFCEDSR